ncbi:MAG: hypothetical protein RRY06_07740 [Lachnospiraceae bacterium]
MSIEIEQDDSDELIELFEFIEHFNVHYSLLIKRYKRFREIDIISNYDIDVITYLDIIIVQLRAMCIESDRYKNNYVAQILLRKVNEPELADKLDAMLNEEFLTGITGFTIRKALKTLADGFICHCDNFDGIDGDEWVMAEIIEKQLRNPYKRINLEYIMFTLIDCIGDGLTIR